MIEQQIAEATECDFKVALETRKPKSWLKSVSAFSNGIGGTLLFGISDDRKPVGLSTMISNLLEWERAKPALPSISCIWASGSSPQHDECNHPHRRPKEKCWRH